MRTTRYEQTINKLWPFQAYPKIKQDDCAAQCWDEKTALDQSRNTIVAAKLERLTRKHSDY